MKIFIFRHAKVNMKWPENCNSADFDQACRNYDESDIIKTERTEQTGKTTANIQAQSIQYKKIYVSSFYRSLRTAQMLFPNEEYAELNVGEVPVKSFTDTAKEIPLWVWDFFGRVQWLANSKRQPEPRKLTIERADSAIIELMKRNEDCVIVTHGFFMRTFIKRLKKSGFAISGNRVLGFKNLQMVAAERKKNEG